MSSFNITEYQQKLKQLSTFSSLPTQSCIYMSPLKVDATEDEESITTLARSLLGQAKHEIDNQPK